MRYLLLLLLSGCASQTLSSPRPGDVLLAPVETKDPPKQFEASDSGITIDWGDRKIRAYTAPAKIPGQDASWQKMYGFGPVILITMKKAQRLLDLRQRLPSHAIERVYHDQWNQRIWLLTQAGIEGPSSAYTVWISEDGGEHWFQGADLERPSPRFPPSDLYTIFVDKMGKGEAWFRLDASHATSEATMGADMALGQEIIYKSSTSDGGRTWNVGKEPIFRNGMIEAPRD
jgi:hypothetical protein